MSALWYVYPTSILRQSYDNPTCILRDCKVIVSSFSVSSVFEPAPVPPPLKRAGELHSIHRTFYPLKRAGELHSIHRTFYPLKRAEELRSIHRAIPVRRGINRDAAIQSPRNDEEKAQKTKKKQKSCAIICICQYIFVPLTPLSKAIRHAQSETV